MSAIAQAPVSREYNPLGKLDPFKPPFQEKRTAGVAPGKSKPKRVVKPTRPLTPLEKYSLGQLSLVGIIRGTSGPSMAMVEVPSGRGYVVKSGTRIGNSNGRVVAIEADKIIVEELREDLLNNIQKVTRELTLKKSAGEG
ncbi:MAG: pilus assembly protein PilP [Deltaproteobacteria bacterium]|nr:pilus assembly protein PilP [Deltaproteobacteria bacterium]